MITITRKFEFDAGHRIPNHKSLCRNLHGHRYVLEVTMQGNIIDNQTASDFGMIIDFGEIKNLIKENLIDKWDHAFLVYEQDTMVLHLLQGIPDHKTVILKQVPTAENLVNIAFNAIDTLLKQHVPNVQITHAKLFETPNCWAECCKK